MKKLILTAALLTLSVSAQSAEITTTPEVSKLFVKYITAAGGECPDVIQLHEMQKSSEDRSRTKVYCGFKGNMYTGLIYEVAAKLNSNLIIVKRSTALSR